MGKDATIEKEIKKILDKDYKLSRFVDESLKFGFVPRIRFDDINNNEEKMTEQTDLKFRSNAIILIYSEAGDGKTSLAMTTNNPYLLDFDGCAHRSMFRCAGKTIEKWEEINANKTKFYQNLLNYDTIIVDTVETGNELVGKYLLELDPKYLALDIEYNQQKSLEFGGFVDMLLNLKKDIIFLCHNSFKPSPLYDEDYKVPFISGGAVYKKILAKSDMVGYLRFDGQERKLIFKKNSNCYTKDTVGIPEVYVPEFNPNIKDATLANIIQEVKRLILTKNEGNMQIEPVAKPPTEEIKTAQYSPDGVEKVTKNGQKAPIPSLADISQIELPKTDTVANNSPKIKQHSKMKRKKIAGVGGQRMEDVVDVKSEIEQTRQNEKYQEELQKAQVSAGMKSVGELTNQTNQIKENLHIPDELPMQKPEPEYVSEDKIFNDLKTAYRQQSTFTGVHDLFQINIAAISNLPYNKKELIASYADEANHQIKDFYKKGILNLVTLEKINYFVETMKMELPYTPQALVTELKNTLDAHADSLGFKWNSNKRYYEVKK